MTPDLGNPKTDINEVYMEFIEWHHTNQNDQLWLSVIDVVNWLTVINKLNSRTVMCYSLAETLVRVWLECGMVEKFHIEGNDKKLYYPNLYKESR